MKRAAPAPSVPQKPASGAASRPDQLVRTDRHTQKLQKFFLPSSQALPDSSPRTESQPEAGRRHSSPAGARPADSCSAQQEASPAEVAACKEQTERKRPRMDSAEGAALAAARDKVQMEAHPGGSQGGLLRDSMEMHRQVPQCKQASDPSMRSADTVQLVQACGRGCSSLCWLVRWMITAHWSRRGWTSSLSIPQLWPATSSISRYVLHESSWLPRLQPVAPLIFWPALT